MASAVQYGEYSAVWRVQCSMASAVQYGECSAVWRVQCSMASTVQYDVYEYTVKTIPYLQFMVALYPFEHLVGSNGKCTK
jgi:hypothetical protein